MIADLTGLMVAQPGLVRNVTITHSFVVVERGQDPVDELDLASAAYRRSDYRRNARFLQARRLASRIKRLMRPHSVVSS